MPTLVECSKCFVRANKDDMFACHFNRETTYECVDEDACKKRSPPEKILSKAEQFELLYGLEFKDLVKILPGTRDRRERYRFPDDPYHQYIWCGFSKKWMTPPPMLGK